MQILFNGKLLDISKNLSLQELMKERHMDKQPAAVELNEKIIEKGNWEKTILHAKDKVEIITFMGGGSR